MSYFEENLFQIKHLTWCLTSTETIKLISDGMKGGGEGGGEQVGIWRWGKG